MKVTILALVLTTLIFAAVPSIAARNLALTARASAQSIYHDQPEMSPSKAIDGRMDTRWGTQERGHWLQLDWDAPQTIVGVVMRNYDEVWNRNRPFTIQVWDASLNGGAGGFRGLITAQSVTGVVVFRFAAVATTRLRVTNAITLWELEVYDDSEALDIMVGDLNRMDIAVAGDSRGRLIGTVSREQGIVPADADVQVSGSAHGGKWVRNTKTDANGCFTAELPLASSGSIVVTARNGDAVSACTADSGDISTALTPRPIGKGRRISLEGPWEIAMDPPDAFPKSEGMRWNPISVPSHWEMAGFVAETERAAYRKRITIPAEWAGKRIKFKSDGIYSRSQVWWNGRRIGAHDGGVTPFELDITDAAKPGEMNTIDILVDDKSDAGQFDAMSYYAHLNIGGIWRPLEIFCVDQAHISRLAIETRLDDSNRDFDLTAMIDIVNERDTPIDDADLAVNLRDARGRRIAAEGLSARISLGPWERKTLRLTSKVKSPDQWSAESAALYIMAVRLSAPGSKAVTIEQKIGFRDVRIVGRTFTLNGRPVKLWGACRHDADPVHGRAIDAKTARLDIELMKGANLNAMRTSHYPPHPEALNAADEMGIYVEDEAPNCFTGVSYGPPTGGRDFVNDLRRAPLCMSLASAMLERDRNHPSVVIWSVCNESAFGRILEMAHLFIKESDATRPVSAGQSANLDIATYHNPTSMKRLRDTADFTMPVLFDEGLAIFQGFGPQADGLEIDPGLRDFWVTAHPAPLEGLWESEHQFGAMIWAWADDAFQVPGKGIEIGRRNLPRTHFVDDLYSKPGYGIVGDPIWGVIDGWRRPRPEWWLCKKLFSPIRIEEKPVQPAATLNIEVENRNFFINMDRYLCKWRVGIDRGELRVSVSPLSKGSLRIPLGRTPSSHEDLLLEFTDGSGRLIDGYRLRFAQPEAPALPASGRPARIIEQPGNLDFGNAIRLVGADSELAFDRSGALLRGLAGRRQVLLSGPDMHIMKSYAPSEQYPIGWRFTGDTSGVEAGDACLNWNGVYGADFSGGFRILMDDAGDAVISYDFTYSGPEIMAREIGLRFEIPLSCDRLEWDRQAEWSYYPDDHIGRPHGVAAAHPKAPQTMPPGKRPFGLDDHPWGCNDFRSTKRNIRWAALTDPAGAGVKVISNGTQHIRATVGTRSIQVAVMDYYGGSATGTPEWDEAYGNGRDIKPGERLQGTVRLQLLSAH